MLVELKHAQNRASRNYFMIELKIVSPLFYLDSAFYLLITGIFKK